MLNTTFLLSFCLIAGALTLLPFSYAKNAKNTKNAGLSYTEKNDSKKSSDIPEKREFILSSKINPCNDFHKYVCDHVENSFKLREDRSSHTFAFSDSSERLLESKKSFFKNIDAENKLNPRSKQFKNFYKACMNESAAKEEELNLVEGLKKELQKIQSHKDFIKVNIQNLTNEKWSLISYGASPNIDNPLIYDIYFDLNLMFLPEHSYYEKPDLIAAYAKLMADFIVTIYPEVTADQALKRAEAVIAFENKFKDTYPKPADFRKRYTEPRYVSRPEFLKYTSVLGLESFFSKNIPEKTLIRDFMPESFQFVQNEILKADLQALKDTYLFRQARGFMDDAFPELFNKRLEFSFKYLGGAPSRPERQERCTRSAMSSFSSELDLELMPRLFPNFPEDKMLTVVEKIRESVLAGITANTWMSEAGKKEAFNKIKKAKLQIISPKTDEEWDFKPIQNYSDSKPYKNQALLAELGHRENFKDFKEGVNQQAWGWGPLVVNAYYSPDKNKFVLPLGILQYPFFVAEGDIIENLGAVGAVTAHELGHAIDDEGAKFDSDGKLRQWMTEDDVKKFKSLGQKMIAQFNKIKHNGELTLGENVADLVGLTFAYKAAFPENKGEIKDKQKFFVAYARVWCNVAREKTIENQLKTDPHSLGFARINEQVKHQPGFQEAFSCKKNNKLYLSEKDRIKIW